MIKQLLPYNFNRKLTSAKNTIIIIHVFVIQIWFIKVIVHHLNFDRNIINTKLSLNNTSERSKEIIDSEFHSGFEFWTLHCSDMNPRTLRNPSGFIVNWAPWISRFNFSILWIRFIIALLNIYLTRDGRPFFSLIGIRWVWKNIGSQMSFLQCLRRLGSRTGKRICNSASSDWTRNTNSV